MTAAVLIVGIGGGTASGKTTVARGIVARLGGRCLWLTHDRYYRNIPPDYLDNPADYNVDHPDSLETSAMVADLHALRRGESVRVPDYDFEKHRRRDPSKWETVYPAPLIIVEGILVLHDRDLRACMDHKVYVKAPDDVRLARRIRRDRAHRGRSKEATLAQYERTVRLMHVAFVEPSRQFADLVLDGTTGTEGQIAAVLELAGITPRRGSP